MSPPTVIYSMTATRNRLHSNTSFISTLPILSFILAQHLSRSLRKLLKMKVVVSLEPSLLSIASSTSNQNMRDLQIENYSPPECHPLVSLNLRIPKPLTSSSSLETVHSSPLPSYQMRIPGTPTIGLSMNQATGPPPQNQRSHSKSVSNWLANDPNKYQQLCQQLVSE